MPEITFLGVGGAVAAHPAGNHTALLVDAGDATLLLDCGPTIMAQLERVGIDAGWPSHVYISHQHGDHILGLPMLLLNRALFFGQHPLAVLAMPSVLQAAMDLVGLAYPDLWQRMQAQVEFVPLVEAADNQPWPGATGLQYRLALGQHSAPSYALRLEWAAGPSLVYSADSGPSPAIGRLASGVDLLVHDSFFLDSANGNLPGHASAAQVGRLAAEAGVKTVALVHREHPESALSEQYRASAARHFGGAILTPDVGDRIVF
jgi:ribonuclease BN (tRNA processing enzyme)